LEKFYVKNGDNKRTSEELPNSLITQGKDQERRLMLNYTCFNMFQPF